MKKSIQNGREWFLLPVLVILLMISIHSNPMNLPTEQLIFPNLLFCGCFYRVNDLLSQNFTEP